MTADVRDRLRKLTEAQKDAALTAVLDLADELDGEAQDRWRWVLRARESNDRDAEFGERGAGDALHDAATRIRAVVAAAGDQP